MTAGSGVDLILLGYRNDVARARVVEFLQQQWQLDPRVERIERRSPLPHPVCRGMHPDDAQLLCDQLGQLGAQVAVRPANGPGLRPGVARTDEQPAPRPGLGAVVLTLLAAALVGGFYLRLPFLYPVHPRALLPTPAHVEVLPPVAESMTGEAPPPAVSEDPSARQRNNEAVLLAQTGQFREAVDALEEALHAAPDDPALVRNLQTVLLNWGIAELAADRVDDAVVHLERAVQLGERVEAVQAFGIALLRQGDYSRAAPLLENALELSPKDPSTLLALSEVYLNLDRRPEALDLLHRAHEAGLQTPEIEKRMQQLSREVDAEWDFVQVEDPHFRVNFAGDDDDASVNIILKALDDAYYAVGSKFNHYPDARTPVVLYTQQDFHTVTQTPDWAGGAFDGRIKIPVRGLTSDDPALNRVVRHEYAHSIVNRLAGPRCPVWLNEGLAVWAEELEEGERATWAEERIADRQLFSLSQLSSSFVSLPRNRVDVAYAQSYLAVRLLVDQYGAQRIPDLLTALGRYGNLNDAFIDVYRENFSKFEQTLFRNLTG